MSLTLFGAIFLAVALVAVIWRRDALLALWPIAAVLQAPAVAQVPVGGASYGITAFNALMPMVAVQLALQVLQARELSFDRGVARAALFGWLAFHAVAIVGAFTLPFVFEGVPVHALILREGLHQAPVPNRYTLANLAQAINAAGIAMSFLHLAQWRDRARAFRALAVGFGIAFAISLAAALHQRLAMLGLWPMGAAFWGSNLGYNQFFHDPGFGPRFGRVGLPFPEPSYASVWFATVAAVGCAITVFVRGRRTLGAVSATLATAALANTVGSSGLLALTLTLPLLVAFALYPWPGLDGAVARRIALAAFAVAGLTTALAIYQVAWGTSAAFAPLRDAFGWTLLKFTDQVTEYRTAAMWRGLAVFVETHGFGAGTGSGRASSWLISLLANLGAIGFAAFAYAWVRQYAPIVRAATREGCVTDWPILAGTACLFAGVGIGVADQNWPVLWVVLLIGYARLRMRA